MQKKLVATGLMMVLLTTSGCVAEERTMQEDVNVVFDLNGGKGGKNSVPVRILDEKNCIIEIEKEPHRFMKVYLNNIKRDSFVVKQDALASFFGVQELFFDGPEIVVENREWKPINDKRDILDITIGVKMDPSTIGNRKFGVWKVERSKTGRIAIENADKAEAALKHLYNNFCQGK